MKKLLRHYIIDTVSLYLVSLTASGLIFGQGHDTLLIAGLGLMAVSIFAKPVINILLLPLNMVTFGLFRWVSSAIAIYLVELLISDFSIGVFNYSGYTSKWFDIPALSFEGFWAYIALSFLLSFYSSTMHWITK